MKRVLVVDDDADVRESITSLLDETYDVLSAYNGVDALRYFAGPDAQRIDAVVLDMMMPVLDGVGFKNELDARGIRVPIVVVSAGIPTAESVRALGTAPRLRKPFDINELEAILERMMRSSGPGGGATSIRPAGRGGTGRGAAATG